MWLLNTNFYIKKVFKNLHAVRILLFGGKLWIFFLSFEHNTKATKLLIQKKIDTHLVCRPAKRKKISDKSIIAFNWFLVKGDMLLVPDFNFSGSFHSEENKGIITTKENYFGTKLMQLFQMKTVMSSHWVNWETSWELICFDWSLNNIFFSSKRPCKKGKKK